MMTSSPPGKNDASFQGKKILILHGSRQTGQLLLGRMDKLRKKLQRMDVQLVAPDAPFSHPQDGNLRQWWAKRTENHCEGLEESINMLKALWNSDSSFEGILGFSQGARMAHLVATTAEHDANAFEGLKYVIMVAGYDVPLPNEWDSLDNELRVPSLHVWGKADRIITPDQSKAVMKHYRNPQHHIHEGGHHVPMRAANVMTYLDFINESRTSSTSDGNAHAASSSAPIHEKQAASATPTTTPEPDEETAMAQQDEVEALSAIFPEEFTLLSKQLDDERYQHPIRYRIHLPECDGVGTWPPHPISLQVEYPPDYPTQSLPRLSLQHENNMMEFSSGHVQMCLTAIQEAAEAECGMPCVLPCVYAAREFFESGGMEEAVADVMVEESQAEADSGEAVHSSTIPGTALLKPVTAERIQECNLQGLEIARALLQDNAFDPGKGGSWKYTVGLVGKPSAGKSTFFNAATGFARQRNDNENAIGGATMAPHPFTTIDPNVGYCLVPAPEGACPEEDEDDSTLADIGTTHGRDSQGRRLLPVMLKDVAGLVPGAYQGRGRGNKFLNDLTDADVLIHVVDASGVADTEGNNVVAYAEDGEKSTGGSHPLEDLSWIRNELVEWVYSNLMYKWDSIKRRGRSKVSLVPETIPLLRCCSVANTYCLH